ncbi:MAG: hypothetical protein ACOYM3_15720, partial [Terrimicrobiaceae bacterium]
MRKEIRRLAVMVVGAGMFRGYSASGQDSGSGGGGSDDEAAVAECDQAPSQDTNIIQNSFFLSLDEGTGAKYRKVGLNGYPIPDEKPQAAAES